MLAVYLIFGLFVFMFFRILLHKEKPVRNKQIVRSNQSKKYYRIDYLSFKRNMQ